METFNRKGKMMEERKPDANTRVPRQELLDAVSFSRKFKSGSLTVLDNVKLTIQGDGDVAIYATDLETGVVSSIESDGGCGENPVDLLIDKKKLADTLKSLKDESVVLEFFAGEEVPDVCPECGAAEFDAPPDEEVLTPSPAPEGAPNWDEKTCSKCGYVGKTKEFYPDNIPAELKVGEFFTLHPVLNVDEFPEFPEFPKDLEDVVITTAGNLRKVVGASTTDNAHFSLDVVVCNKEDGVMVATDGHRLHTVKTDIERDLTLPAGTIKTLIAGKKDDDDLIFSLPPEKTAICTDGLKKAELVELWEKHNNEKLSTNMTVAEIKTKLETIPCENAYMRTGNMKITMRLPETMFPDYKAVTSPKDLQEIVVKAGILREGMKQALVLTATTEMAVKVSFNGSIDLETVVEGDSYNRASVKIVSGGIEPPVSHNYNARYISDILGLFKDDVSLTLSVPEKQKPLFFNDNAGFEGLVMPTRTA